jgi:hypothetical protein
MVLFQNKTKARKIRDKKEKEVKKKNSDNSDPDKFSSFQPVELSSLPRRLRNDSPNRWFRIDPHMELLCATHITFVLFLIVVDLLLLLIFNLEFCSVY